MPIAAHRCPSHLTWPNQIPALPGEAHASSMKPQVCCLRPVSQLCRKTNADPVRDGCRASGVFTLTCDHLRAPLLGILRIIATVYRANITETPDGHTSKVRSLYVCERAAVANTVRQHGGASLRVFSQLAGTQSQPLQSNRCLLVFVPP